MQRVRVLYNSSSTLEPLTQTSAPAVAIPQVNANMLAFNLLTFIIIQNRKAYKKLTLINC